MFDPKGRWLATSSWDDSTVKLWDLTTGQLKAPPLRQGRSSKVAVSPNGDFLACGGGQDGSVDLWETDPIRYKSRLATHSDAVMALDFSPDSTLLASASADHSIALWDVRAGKLEAKLRGHSLAVWSVAFTPNGEQLVSASEDGTIRVWNVKHIRNRLLDYAQHLKLFNIQGRSVVWKDRPVQSPMPVSSFSRNSLIARLSDGSDIESTDRKLFARFLRACDLKAASLLLARYDPQRWEDEKRVLDAAFVKESKTVLGYESYRLAAQHAERARHYLPEKSAEAWHVTALAERGLKRWPEALAAIDKAVALERDNPQFWHDKALILEEQDQRPAAREALTRAIELARKADEKDSRLSIWAQRMEQLQR